MKFVLVHPQLGVFLGVITNEVNRSIYWSGVAAPKNVKTALVFEDEELAMQVLHDNNLAQHFGNDLVEVHAVEKGDYEELSNMGLDVTAMTFSLPEYTAYDHIVPVGVIQ